MYEAFYNLSDDPFRLLPDPTICFPHTSCAKAWAYLRYALKRGEGIVVVTGPPGSGKTTLAERLLTELNPAKTVSVRLIANDLNATDLLRKLAYSFGLPVEGMDRAMLVHRIERYLIELEHAGRRALVVIDEAQTLSHHSLEAMRLLTDLQSRSRPVLQLILLGQEELEGVMCAPGMEQFQHRVIASCRLHTMSLVETKAYLEYRLAYAEWRGDPSINGPAVMAIFRHSKGLPRHINKICSRLMLYGSTEEKHALNDRDVHAVVNDLRDELLAPLGGDSAAAADQSSGIFDSVYDLALVPSSAPRAAVRTTTRDAMAALYLAEETTSAEADASLTQPAARRWSRSKPGSEAYAHRLGRRRSFGLRRLLRRLLRLPLDTVTGGVALLGRAVSLVRYGSAGLGAGVLSRLRAAGARLRGWEGLGLAEVRAWLTADQGLGRRRVLMAGLAASLVAAVALLTANIGNRPDGPSGDRMVAVQAVDPDQLLLAGGILDDPARYLELAAHAADQLGGPFAAARRLIAGEGGQETVHVPHLSGVDGELSKPLLGKVIGDVAGLLVARAAQMGSSLGIWTLARSDQTISASGTTMLSATTQTSRRPDAAVPSMPGAGERVAARAEVPMDDPGATSASDTQQGDIALIVSREGEAGMLDFVRFLPAPAAGVSISQVSGQPGEGTPLATTEIGAAVAIAPDDTAMAADATGEWDETIATRGDDAPPAGATGEDAQQAGADTVVVALATTDGGVRLARAAELARLVALGDAALARDRLLLPENDSAYGYYRQALAIDEQDAAAQAGIARIGQRYRALARKALAEQVYDRADRYVARALRVDPDDRATLTVRAEIADARSRAAAEATAAAAARAEAEWARIEAEMKPVEPPPAPKKRQLSAFERLMRYVDGRSY